MLFFFFISFPFGHARRRARETVMNDSLSEWVEYVLLCSWNNCQTRTYSIHFAFIHQQQQQQQQYQKILSTILVYVQCSYALSKPLWNVCAHHCHCRQRLRRRRTFLLQFCFRLAFYYYFSPFEWQTVNKCTNNKISDNIFLATVDIGTICVCVRCVNTATATIDRKRICMWKKE